METHHEDLPMLKLLTVIFFKQATHIDSGGAGEQSGEFCIGTGKTTE